MTRSKVSIASIASIAGVAVAVGLGSAAGVPAEASAPRKDNTIGMYEDPGYAGSLYVLARPAADCIHGCHGDIDGWDGDNEISSVLNNSKCTVELHADDDGGKTVTLEDGKSAANLEGLGFDNEAESYSIWC